MQDVISLGIGEPDFVTPDVILPAGIASLQHSKTRYTSNSGTAELRRAISANLETLYGVHYDPESEILVTVGVSEALYLAMTDALLDPGDEVIVPQPCWRLAMPACRITSGVTKSGSPMPRLMTSCIVRGDVEKLADPDGGTNIHSL